MRSLSVQLPMEQSLPLVLPGQFCGSSHFALHRASASATRAVQVHLRVSRFTRRRQCHRTCGSTPIRAEGAKARRTFNNCPTARRRCCGISITSGRSSSISARRLPAGTTRSTSSRFRSRPAVRRPGDRLEQAELIERLHTFLDLPGALPDTKAIVDSLIGADTVTWSGRRSRREIYWNAEVEARFQAARRSRTERQVRLHLLIPR